MSIAVPTGETASKPRRDFTLREHEVEYLTARQLAWQTMSTEQGKWLVITQYPVPEGYGSVDVPIRFVRIALRIPPNYPDEQIDMVFVDPPLRLQNGRQIPATTPQPVVGGMFQQWSRHRTSLNPWRPGDDGIDTHLLLVDYWFQLETQR